MTESLESRLRALHVEHLIRSAEAIRNWPTNRERFDLAVQYVREAMYLCTIGKITQAEESRVLSILDFAMPYDRIPHE
jgi:hypothetical protein